MEHDEDFRVKDIELATWGRKEIQLAEVEMPGLMACRSEYGPTKPLAGARITGSLHMTIQTAVLIETLRELGAQVRWCSCNIYSTQDHAASAIAAAKTAAVFAWKNETMRDYWECTLKALLWPGGKGPTLIVDDGGDATIMVLEGVRYEKLYEESRTLPDPESVHTEDEKGLLQILKESILEAPSRY